MQPSPLHKPFVIPKELLQETDALNENISSPVPSRMNMIAKYIAHAVPKTRKKYILPIMEKLRMVRMGEYRSNGNDLFSYLTRNERTDRNPPIGFNPFYKRFCLRIYPYSGLGINM
ncbi:uncharacterized protein CEXT_266881 [Caerostris extrusa]|uniref:Uncharacterized protein n=1 Tax=Caerostris extrusa TaxID=172846 RepID=A0AAV4UTP3_CAEEX|nr:uncharacterized protein CEXT_266881 [Caerostris extrusa]